LILIVQIIILIVGLMNGDILGFIRIVHIVNASKLCFLLGTLFGFSHVGLCTTIHPTRVLHDKSRVTRPLKSLKFVFMVHIDIM
jgi:hypothetical protein